MLGSVFWGMLLIDKFMLDEIFGKHPCQLLMSHAHTLKLKTGK